MDFSVRKYVKSCYKFAKLYYFFCLGNYIGCFKDDINRDLNAYVYGYGYGQESCDLACSKYLYFALQDDGWCVCDDSYSTPSNIYPKIDLKQCFFPPF